jgi:hypothetical protein
MPYERFFAPLRMTRNKVGKLFNHESRGRKQIKCWMMKATSS